LVRMLMAKCSSGGYGCPLGCKGKKGCGSIECKTRPRPDDKGEPIANICLSTNTNLKNFKMTIQGTKWLPLWTYKRTL
jgi:CRISPR/Cas system CMR-associated protein Cmr1 (group 7 of RAMP superfamily)